MEHQLLIGKFTLESLTSGLYVSPLDLYREYVQNAADSIDEALEQGILKKGEEKISITVSESERIIKISDNGTGVGDPLDKHCAQLLHHHSNGVC